MGNVRLLFREEVHMPFQLSLFDRCQLKVVERNAAFNQRFTISGSANSDGSYPGIVGTNVDVIGQGQGLQPWTLAIQHNDGSGWADSELRQTPQIKSGSKITFNIESEDLPGSGDADFNDLVLHAECVPITDPILEKIRGIAVYNQILFGVVTDERGVVLPPGGGPQPVPPWVGFPPAEQDILMGLVINKIASLVNNAQIQKEIQRTALNLVSRGAQQLVDVIARYRMVTAGDDLTCAVAPVGSVNCWGNNDHGEFGDGTRNPSLEGSSASDISDAVEVAAGRQYACAVHANGTLSCWGSNLSGQLGNGTLSSSLTPFLVPGISGVAHVATGASHTCAVNSNGSVKCWGSGLSGELGNDLTQNSATPVDVVGISTATAVTVGNSHSCALLRDGIVMCWGDNALGRLGKGTTAKISAKPVAVPNIKAVAVVAGGFHTCALLSDGTIKCWGSGSDGQLGNGIVGPGGNPDPQQVLGLSGAIAVAAGNGHTCAILADRTVRCWGRNSEGQLGNDTISSKGIPTPVKVSSIASAVAVTGGFQHTCVLLKDRTIKCWGNNREGQLTDGTTKNSSVPVP
jgi:alpha-tubulin suppressor-like RCC1 family protein